MRTIGLLAILVLPACSLQLPFMNAGNAAQDNAVATSQIAAIEARQRVAKAPPLPLEKPWRSIGPSYSAVGVASWYGHPFHGRITADGSVYDMNAVSAAHRSLPFGTRVRVTNLNNGRSLDLTINDRGPFIDGRIIDVSRRAAELLGFEHDGLADVKLAIRPPERASLSAVEKRR